MRIQDQWSGNSWSKFEIRCGRPDSLVGFVCSPGQCFGVVMSNQTAEQPTHATSKIILYGLNTPLQVPPTLGTAPKVARAHAVVRSAEPVTRTENSGISRERDRAA